MGDNRDDSLDSRFPASKGGVGMVPVENLIGRALVHLLVDRRQRLLCEALDLVHGASRGPHRQWLRGSCGMSADVAPFVRDKLGHEPNDLALVRACAHPFERRRRTVTSGSNSSATGCSDMVIARALYERYPNEPKAICRKRYNVLVDRETCAENGREIGVPALVRLGKQAREDGASQSENVVGDVVEALIGALFLDGGLEAAERFILDLWEPDLADQRRAPQHPKSALQELAAARELQGAGL